jgi:hypothetical protein
MRRLIHTVAVLALLPTVASAACYGYYCTGTIQAMSIANDNVYVRLTGGTNGLTNCTPYQSEYITLPKSNPNYSSYYAVLLAAYLAKESITLRPTDASPNCSLLYIAVP